jgi:hypothetical protein
MENKMKMLSNKGFAVGDISGFALIFGITAIIMGLVVTILTQIQGTQVVGSLAANVTGRGITAVSDLSSWLPTFVVSY